MKKILLLSFVTIIFVQITVSQNVGIGIEAPAHKLDVLGDIHGSNAYFDAAVGIGTTSPLYKFQVNNGPVALYNTTDSKAWYFNYSSSSNFFYLNEDATIRMVVANGGNVGIGTLTPAVKLDVSGDANVSGGITVNGGKGIIRNASGSAQLRYYTRQATFTAILGPLGTSPEGSIGFSGFTGTPQVFVGDIVSTGGTVGELFRVQLVIYDVTPGSCHARLINTSNGPVNYSITWNIICIGN